MRLYILNSVEGLNNAQIIEQLDSKVEIIFEKVPKKLLEVEGIQDQEEKILAIDIDFNMDGFISAEILSQIPNLKAVIVSSTSYSWLDIEFLRKNDIYFSNTSDFSSNAVAEWGVFMLLNLVRKIPILVKQGGKTNYEIKGREIKDMKVGIIGLGNIGMQFAKRMEGFTSDISYWSRSKKDVGYVYKSIEDIFKESDIVYFSMVKDSNIKQLLPIELLKHARKDQYFLSCTSMYDAMHHKLLELAAVDKIAGYGFESDEEIDRFQGNVYTGLVMGWCTEESIKNASEKWFKNVNKYIDGNS